MLATLDFFKYHGLGNHFIVIDQRQGAQEFSSEHVRRWCDPHRGIGADGVLEVRPSTKADVAMVVHNADGTLAGMCGNGIRCVACYIQHSTPQSPRELCVEVDSLIYPTLWHGDDLFSVQMGAPRKNDAQIPPPNGDHLQTRLDLSDRSFTGFSLSMGNPHFVCFCDQDAPHILAQRYGAELEGHPFFPNRANISFVKVRDDGLEVVVHERGVGVTQACGSGACAVAVAATRRGYGAKDVKQSLFMPGGTLWVTVHDNEEITMLGEAKLVFRGHIAI
jgi:diaminopimelate epimerase